MLSTRTTIEAHRDQAVELFRDVFRSMLRLEIEPCGERAGLAPEPAVTSAVFFAGAWKGAAMLECGLNAAIRITGRMMPGSEPGGFDADVQDCLGELANMLGGNIKALLPPGVDLSIPSVIQGGDYSVHLCGNNSFLRIPFACEAGEFVVIIVEVAPR